MSSTDAVKGMRAVLDRLEVVAGEVDPLPLADLERLVAALVEDVEVER